MGISTERFEEYVSLIAQTLGHADRVEPFSGYCTGLLMPLKRKSVEPMAAHLAPSGLCWEHQRLHHFVADAPWPDEAVLDAVRSYALERISRRAGSPEALIIDDTGFPKKGKHSVGVARQYCGQLGKQDNCQVAVSLSIANHHASLPIPYSLYLPHVWAGDAARRRRARVPDEIEFKTKPEIALEEIRAAHQKGLPVGVVLMDAGYGASTELRTGVSALALSYVAGILPQTKVWAPPQKQKKSRGRQSPKRSRRNTKRRRISVKELAMGLPKKIWKKT